MKKFIQNKLREGLNESELQHKVINLYENKYLNEAVEHFNYDSDKPSPTIEWDIVQDKIDKSVEQVKTLEDARDYLTGVNIKIHKVAPKYKKRLKKYVISALIGTIGLTSLSKIIDIPKDNVKPNTIDLVNNPQSVDHSSNNPKIGKERPEEKVGPTYNLPTNVSDNLIKSLKHDEGSIKQKGEPVLKAYKLGDNKITVGWGHAEPIDNSNFKEGQIITKAKAEELFKKDVLKSKDDIDDIFREWKAKGIEFDISQGMYDAMISMDYNMGRSGFRNTEFIQLVKKGEYNKAKEHIKKTKISSKFPGLKVRRDKESEMFDTTHMN